MAKEILCDIEAGTNSYFGLVDKRALFQPGSYKFRVQLPEKSPDTLYLARLPSTKSVPQGTLIVYGYSYNGKFHKAAIKAELKNSPYFGTGGAF